MSSETIEKQMLEELQKIRETLEPKPDPPAPEPQGFQAEFMAFLNKYGIIGLAIAFIIGGAAGALISALVGDILMPIITFFIPGGGWREAIWVIGPIQLSIGHFTGTLIDFIVIAIVVFILMKQLTKTGLS